MAPWTWLAQWGRVPTQVPTLSACYHWGENWLLQRSVRHMQHMASGCGTYMQAELRYVCVCLLMILGHWIDLWFIIMIKDSEQDGLWNNELRWNQSAVTAITLKPWTAQVTLNILLRCNTLLAYHWSLQTCVCFFPHKLQLNVVSDTVNTFMSTALPTDVLLPQCILQ